jgi:F-type H+-transporting ATPase subunit b
MLTFQESTPVLRAGLIDLDVTWLVQIGLFLLVYAVLAFGFFRPYAALLRRRDEATKGRKEHAAGLLAEAQALEQKVEGRLAEARAEAVRIRRDLVEEGRAQRDRLVAAERERAQATVDTALAQLESEKRRHLADLDRAAGDVAALIEAQVRAGGAK